MINVVRVSMNRINAKPTVTSGLNLRDLGLHDHAEQPRRGRTAVHHASPGSSRRRRAAAVREPRQQRLRAVTDDLTWVSGRHSMKFGGDLRRDQIKLAFINRPNGDFTFAARNSPATRSRISCSASRPSTARRPAIRISTARRGSMRSTGRTSSGISRVTLNYGVRYEVQRPFVESQDHLNAFHPGQQSTKFPHGAARARLPRRRRRPARNLSDRQEQRRAARSRRCGTCAATAGPSVRARVGRVLRHAAGPGRLLPERHARAAVPAADRSQLSRSTSTTSRSRTRWPGVSGHARLPAGSDLHRLGAGLRDAGRVSTTTSPCSSRSAPTAGRRGRLRRIARQEPADLHGDQSDDPDSDPRRRDRAAAASRRSAGAADVLGGASRGTTRCRRARGCGRGAASTCSRRTRWGHAIDHVSGLNIGGENAADAAGHDRRPGVDRRGARAREGRRALRRASPLRAQLRLRAAAADRSRRRHPARPRRLAG